MTIASASSGSARRSPTSMPWRDDRDRMTGPCHGSHRKIPQAPPSRSATPAPAVSVPSAGGLRRTRQLRCRESEVALKRADREAGVQKGAVGAARGELRQVTVIDYFGLDILHWISSDAWVGGYGELRSDARMVKIDKRMIVRRGGWWAPS